MTDCLIIGFNDSDFEKYVDMLRAMGTDSGAYRDINLAFIEYNAKPYRALEILSFFYLQNKSDEYRPFRNTDFLSPAILYLGTYLARRGFSFDYINSFHLEKEKLREKLEQDDILTIAITTTLYVSPHPILEIVSFIKQYNQRAKIIIGGPYILNQSIMLDASALEQIFTYINGDIYVISQEGEFALVNILNTLKNGGKFDKIANIAYHNGDSYVLTSKISETNPLKKNVPDYSLFPKPEIGEFISIRTAKSCPFACAYCGYSERAGRYRYVDVQTVEQELNAIRDIGTVTTLTFIDDTFNVPKKRFQEILRMMIRNNYGFKWNSYYRCDYGDEETINLMKEAGCEGVFLGIESGSNEMLKRMNKTSRREHYLKAIPALKNAGIISHANLIVGFPGETERTVQETLELIEETKPDFYRTQLWYCDPITPVWKQRDEYSITGSAFNWSHNTMNAQTAFDLLEEKFFLGNHEAVWLPQNGFEVWSIFYLQRRGMTLNQIKNFLRCFQSLVQEKLLYPHKETLNPELLEKLKQSCQFDSPIQEIQVHDIQPATAEELQLLDMI